jgi:hypothetical protein
MQATDVLKALLPVVPAALLYVIGIIFTENFLSQFDINFTEVEISTTDVFTLSMAAFSERNFIAGTIFVCAAFVTTSIVMEDWRNRFLWGAVSVALVALSLTAAKAAAESRSRELWETRGAQMELLMDTGGLKMLQATRAGRTVNKCLDHVSASARKIFADRKHTYLICSVKSESVWIGRVIKMDLQGKIVATWKMERDES